MLATDWCRSPRATLQLYDLKLAPNEANNVASDPRYRKVLDIMESRLDQLMKVTKDPFSTGRSKSPKGQH